MPDSPLPKIVYSPKVDISIPGLSWIHPFDGKKYSKAWNLIKGEVGEENVNRYRIDIPHPVSDSELRAFHSDFAINLLKRKKIICAALEVPLLKLLPLYLIDKWVVEPIKYAVEGTYLATRNALESGLVFNLGGGFHHAMKNRGEGFCLYADVPVAVSRIRKEGLLSSQSVIGIIDVDAHQGQGFERCFSDDPSVRILDVYNSDIYPRDEVAKGYIDERIELTSGCGDEEYLSRLRDILPKYLDEHGPFDLMYVNAGTDVFQDDPLGRLALTEQGVLQRDLMIVDALRQRNIPTVFLTSGGYTKDSYRLIANTIVACI